jgi:hypothetical protein
MRKSYASLKFSEKNREKDPQKVYRNTHRTPQISSCGLTLTLEIFSTSTIIKHRPNSDHQIGGYELTFPTIEGAEPATLARNTKWLWLPFWQKCLHYLVLN